ncbi:MAG: hypothetical protein KBD03_03475 [Gammaproteobacteria bacterium]|nr:hypothetical protein [Gammaproteobacteria bacterium]
MTKSYTNKITLVKNDRGVWGLDPFKGCPYGMGSIYTSKDFGLFETRYNSKRGCYGICYANSIAKFRGFNFAKLQKRDFLDQKHFDSISKKLKKIDFVRLGVNCDPSTDWGHTLKIIGMIKPYIKNIVVITKHWNELTQDQLKHLNGVCVNTSVSALDNEHDLMMRMYWYNELKKHCKSVLRVCTASFNDMNLKKLQDKLLNNENVIDNVLRFNKNHELVKAGIINVKKYKFLKTNVYASKHKEDIYFGHCDGCLEKCGIGL